MKRKLLKVPIVKPPKREINSLWGLIRYLYYVIILAGFQLSYGNMQLSN